eukprot:1076742-Alexandrium_andersonii.AAC.1
MSASLVGSEMCIRDSLPSLLPGALGTRHLHVAVRRFGQASRRMAALVRVSVVSSWLRTEGAPR